MLKIDPNGKPCRRCMGTARYITSGRCVACKHALSVAEWQRKKALQRHDID